MNNIRSSIECVLNECDMCCTACLMCEISQEGYNIEDVRGIRNEFANWFIPFHAMVDKVDGAVKEILKKYFVEEVEKENGQ